MLDLSGMTKSVRESRNFLRAQFVYINGNIVTSKSYQVEIGAPVTIEIRFPNGVTKTEVVTAVNRPVLNGKPRQTGPTVLNRQG